MSLNYSCLTTLFAALLTAAPAQSQHADEWAQWRGPSGQGYVTGEMPPLEWSDSKNLLWKTELPGGGHSTPVIWGDRLFLTCADASGERRWVVCIETKTGKIRWQDLASKGITEQIHSTNSQASPSCVTDGKYVYAFFGTPGMFCFDLDGKRIWEHQFGIFTSETHWGIGASPVLFENLVIQNCDNDGPRFLPPGRSPKDAAPASLVALDKTTGRIVWETPREQGRGFSTPVLIPTENGRLDLVLNGPFGVWGYDPKTGRELWHCLRHPDEDNNRFGEPMPLHVGSIMFAAAGRESGYLQAIRLGGNGDVTGSGLVWEMRRKGVRDVGSGVLVDKFLIFADGRSNISAHDIKTGKQLYFERIKSGKSGQGAKGFYASPIVVDGLVLCLHQVGRTFVVKPGPKLEIVRENVLSDGTDFSASPAVANGRLYLRSQTHLYCIGNKE